MNSVRFVHPALREMSAGECWNDGIMGFGPPARRCTILRLGEKMENWYFDNIHLYREFQNIDK